MRQHKDLQRFPREDAWSVIHYEWEARRRVLPEDDRFSP
jgi:hypothetical protein